MKETGYYRVHLKTAVSLGSWGLQLFDFAARESAVLIGLLLDISDEKNFYRDSCDAIIPADNQRGIVFPNESAFIEIRSWGVSRALNESDPLVGRKMPYFDPLLSEYEG
jgi:hypothetical protein